MFKYKNIKKIKKNIFKKKLIKMLNTIHFRIMVEQEIININNKLIEYNNKLDTLLSINQDLIAQNLKLSDSLLGKVKESVSPEDENKPLYYYLVDNIIHVYGTGTFSKLDTLRKNGSWNGEIKAWIMKTSINEDKIKELFPKIILQSR